MERNGERDRVMALLIGLAIVAVALIVLPWLGPRGIPPGFFGRGPMDGSMLGFGPLPWLLFGVLAGITMLAFRLIPLILLGLGALVVYRWLSHGSPGSPRLPRLNLRGHGPGSVPPPPEQGIFCPSCNRPVSRDWATCPHCGYRKYVAPDLIQRRCSTCGTELHKAWNACPYCSTRIDEPVTVPAPGPAQPGSAPAGEAPPDLKPTDRPGSAGV